MAGNQFKFTSNELDTLFQILEQQHDKLYDKWKAANYKKKRQDTWSALIAAIRNAEPNLRDGITNEELEHHIKVHVNNMKKQGEYQSA